MFATATHTEAAESVSVSCAGNVGTPAIRLLEAINDPTVVALEFNGCRVVIELNSTLAPALVELGSNSSVALDKLIELPELES